MNSRPIAFARCVPAACALLVIAGCQSYTARPLDLDATREAWAGRAPSDQSVREFAERLYRSEGRGAAVFDPSDGLMLGEAEAVALVFNRELRAARLEAGVARAGAENAGRWDDPELGVDIARIVSGVPDPWVVAGTIGLTLPISGRLGAERARAGAEYAAELERLAAREWATRMAVRERWVEWSAEAVRVRLAEELVERLSAVSELAARQERTGVMTRIDERLLRVELAGGRAGLIGAHAREAEAELRLRDLLGLAPTAPVRFVEGLAGGPAPAEGGALRAAAEAGNPELAVARREYDAAEESLRLEIRRQYPDLTIGPGAGSDQGDERVIVGLRIPLPVWNRNARGIAEATARREAARGRFESVYEQVMLRLTIARGNLLAARALREAVESGLVPLADEQDAEVRRVAELGRVDPLLLLQTLKAHYEAKVRLLEARAAEAVGAIRLDELIGPPAPDASPTAPGGPVPDPQIPLNPAPPVPGGRS